MRDATFDCSVRGLRRQRIEPAERTQPAATSPRPKQDAAGFRRISDGALGARRASGNPISLTSNEMELSFYR
jgi:hypothetical protein